MDNNKNETLRQKVAAASPLDATQQARPWGAGRQHDPLVTIEEMTPSECKNGGESLSIHYSYATTPFGDMLVASTPKGICRMEFADDHAEAFLSLQATFPKAHFRQAADAMQANALQVFAREGDDTCETKLHLKGTPFQMKVWEALLKIPMGGMATYGDIATSIGHPRACRAVGTAVGHNPVALLIPCHRVIRATGETGNYHWGKERKAAIIGWEAARKAHEEE